MTDHDDNRWQWDIHGWDDSPAAPTSPEQVPDPDDPGGLAASVRALLRRTAWH